MEKQKILIVDDSEMNRDLLIDILEDQYDIVEAENGAEAVAILLQQRTDFSLLLLDIMMPGMDGVEVLKRLREKGVCTPALFLTAKTEIDQRVEGLDAGADDYLPKPFFKQELLARVRAMLRRRDNYVPDLCKFGGLILNRSTYELQCEDKKTALSGREFQIMEMLMDRPNFIIPIDDFMSHVWGWESDVDVSVIWVHISNIRKKLASMKANVEIRFIRGAGYKLEEANDL